MDRRSKTRNRSTGVNSRRAYKKRGSSALAGVAAAAAGVRGAAERVALAGVVGTEGREGAETEEEEEQGAGCPPFLSAAILARNSACFLEEDERETERLKGARYRERRRREGGRERKRERERARERGEG